MLAVSGVLKDLAQAAIVYNFVIHAAARTAFLTDTAGGLVTRNVRTADGKLTTVDLPESRSRSTYAGTSGASTRPIIMSGSQSGRRTSQGTVQAVEL